MIVEKDFLGKLKEFGLNSYESKLWIALLSRGSSTAGELSDIAGVPRSRSYDVLESLERKGFILMKLGKPIRYVAVAPHDVLETIKSKTTKEAESQMKQIDGLKTSDTMKELLSLHNQGITLIEPTQISGSIKGQQNIESHMSLMFKKAQNSILLMLTPEDIAKKHDFLHGLIEDAKGRGVKTTIFSPSKKQLSKKINISNLDINGRFIVTDKKELLFMLTDEGTHPSYEVAVWINTSFFASTLWSMVENQAKQKIY